MDVVHRQAGACVGAGANTKHPFLQLGFAHLGDDGRMHFGLAGLRSVGVQCQKHRIEIAAVGQALLRIQQGGLLVFIAHGQAGDAEHAIRVITGAAFVAGLFIARARGVAQLQWAKVVSGARGVVDGQIGRLCIGVNIGLALDNAGRGKALGMQGAQALGFGAAPGGLGEFFPGRESPLLSDVIALPVAVRFIGIQSGKTDIGAANGGGGAGIDLDRDRHRSLLGIRRVFKLQLDLGREIAQRTNQVADVAVGRVEQADHFAAAQIGVLAEAHQLQMLLQQGAHIVWCLHFDAEAGRP